MDVQGLLATHEAQHPELAGIVGDIGSMLTEIDEVEGAQYQPTRAAQLVAEIRETTAKAIADEAREMLDAAARADDAALAQRDDAERARLTSANGHDVDPRRFTNATAAEISMLLTDAAAVDPDTLKRSWAFALPVLKGLAAKEAREYRQPGSTSAFNTWTVWQSRVASATHRAPDRAAMADGSQRRRRELRERILAVCRLVSLDTAVAKLLLAADVAERSPNGGAVKSTLTVGKWFDQFGPTRK